MMRARDRLEDEIGDMLFVCANLARHAKVDPGTALRRANRKFERRFRAMETLAAAEGVALDALPLEAQDATGTAQRRTKKAGSAMTRQFASFRDFYPFYLAEHANRTSRRLHFIGSCGVLSSRSSRACGATRAGCWRRWPAAMDSRGSGISSSRRIARRRSATRCIRSSAIVGYAAGSQIYRKYLLKRAAGNVFNRGGKEVVIRSAINKARTWFDRDWRSRNPSYKFFHRDLLWSKSGGSLSPAKMS